MNKLLIGLLLLTSSCTIRSPEQGKHSGVIIDLAEKGVFCTTFEGTIQSGSGNSSIAYSFTASDRAVFEKLKEAQESKKEVIIYYKTGLITSICNSSNGRIVTDVK